MSENPRDFSKRHLLKRSLAGAVATWFSARGGAGVTPADEERAEQPVALSAAAGIRPWLSPELWANRCQDWQLAGGRIECLRGGKGDEVRTVFLLTREVVAGRSSARIALKTGLLTAPGQQGFCGFMLGIGAGKLDYRAAALAQRGSGKGGGFLAVLDTSGAVMFRDFSDERNPLAYRQLRAEVEQSPEAPVQTDREYGLVLDIKPDRKSFAVMLSVYDQRNRLLARSVRRGVADAELLGALRSCPHHRPAAPGPAGGLRILLPAVERFLWTRAAPSARL